MNNKNSILDILGITPKFNETFSNIKMKDYIKDCEAINGMFDKLNVEDKKKVLDSLNKLSETFDDMFGIKSEKWTMEDLTGSKVKCDTKSSPLGDVTVVTITPEEKKEEKKEDKKVEKPVEKKPVINPNANANKIETGKNEENKKPECSLNEKMKEEIKKIYENKKNEEENIKSTMKPYTLKDKLMDEYKNSMKLESLNYITNFIKKALESSQKCHYTFETKNDKVCLVFTVPTGVIMDSGLKLIDINEPVMLNKFRTDVAAILDVQINNVVVSAEGKLILNILIQD